MQEIKILAILSLVYFVSFSFITLINILIKNNHIIRTLNLKSKFNSQNTLFYGFILALIGTLSS